MVTPIRCLRSPLLLLHSSRFRSVVGRTNFSLSHPLGPLSLNSLSRLPTPSPRMMDDPKPSSPTPPRAISPLHTDYRPTMFDTHETKVFDVILQTASRLLFSDGFQQQIIDAIHVIHSQLRPTLRLEGTDETMRSIDASCNLLMKTLTGWSQRQRSLCDSISRVNLEALRYVLPANFETHTEVMDELRTIFRYVTLLVWHIFLSLQKQKV